jgi:hypothetical protein
MQLRPLQRKVSNLNKKLDIRVNLRYPGYNRVEINKEIQMFTIAIVVIIILVALVILDVS